MDRDLQKDAENCETRMGFQVSPEKNQLLGIQKVGGRDLAKVCMAYVSQGYPLTLKVISTIDFHDSSAIWS